MKIGISIGDINGIGLEVLIKCFTDKRMYNYVTPILYGSAKIVAYHRNIVKASEFQYYNINDTRKAVSNKLNVINCWDENVNISLGKATDESAKFATISLERMCNDLKSGFLDGIVTLPINKHLMKKAGFRFDGHTEYLENKFGGDSLMFLISDDLRVATLTNHVPVSQVSSLITKELIDKKLRLLNQTLIVDFGIERPNIAVLGLNPHAGDGGMLGQEEETIIRPAIIEAKKKGINVAGPYPADGFFGSANFKKFDAILAMYHDQGLIPFKALTFDTGVNYTAGLSIVRTSPDHGTAYDIAGQNIASEKSLRKSILMACDIIKNRQEYHESRANQLVKQRPADIGDEDEILVE